MKERKLFWFMLFCLLIPFYYISWTTSIQKTLYQTERVKVKPSIHCLILLFALLSFIAMLVLGTLSYLYKYYQLKEAYQVTVYFLISVAIFAVALIIERLYTFVWYIKTIIAVSSYNTAYATFAAVLSIFLPLPIISAMMLQFKINDDSDYAYI